jgi:hypothetical protein
MDCHEPHPTSNEKTQPIQWTKRPTGALVAVNSLWPAIRCPVLDCFLRSAAANLSTNATETTQIRPT